MKQFIAIVLLLVVVAFWASNAELPHLEIREMTPTEQIMISRTTPPVSDADDGRSASMLAVFAAMVAVMALITLATVGQPFLRQFRLLVKDGRRRARPRRPAAPARQMLPPPSEGEWYEHL